MITVLAFFGGIVLVIFILIISARTRTILKANKTMENTIRNCWAHSGITDPDIQDDISLTMMREICFNTQTLDQYRLALGAVRSLSHDIVKNKQRLEEFKRELLMYGAQRGWTINI